jgi:hypothetical protein
MKRRKWPAVGGEILATAILAAELVLRYVQSLMQFEPLELLPFGGGDACYYNIVRDNRVQSYHQYRYAKEWYP